MSELRKQLEAVFARVSSVVSSNSAVEADLLLITAVVGLEGPDVLLRQDPHTLKRFSCVACSLFSEFTSQSKNGSNCHKGHAVIVAALRALVELVTAAAELEKDEDEADYLIALVEKGNGLKPALNRLGERATRTVAVNVGTPHPHDGRTEKAENEVALWTAVAMAACFGEGSSFGGESECLVSRLWEEQGEDWTDVKIAVGNGSRVAVAAHRAVILARAPVLTRKLHEGVGWGNGSLEYVAPID